MENFLKEIIKWEKFELLIDSNVFSKDIILKTAYLFLDRWYFFFKYDLNWNFILQFSKKNENTELPENIINEFSSELISVYLRDRLEKDNKVIREAIVTKAIAWPLDLNNFVSFDSEELQKNREKNEINFQEDLEEIISELKNDPNLDINEDELKNILKEVNDELTEIEKPKIVIDKDSISKIKKNFNK